MSTRRLCSDEGGFTLIEVMVASTLLVGALFSLVALGDRASSTTAATAAREGGTSLGRELVETTRSVPYTQLTTTSVQTALQTRPGIADSSSAAGYTISRRGVTYTATLTACAIDDPKDNYGSHAIDATFCSNQTQTGTADKNADDARRVVVDVHWDRGGKSGTNRQTTVVNNPVGGLGPSVTSLTMSTPLGRLTDSLLELASFNVTTSQAAARVDWYIDGVKRGEAGGSGTNWSFNWPLLANGTVLVRDGTYEVQARAIDQYGRAGAAKSLSINLNRFAPASVTGLAGGRNGTGTDVDLEWDANPEEDVVGYRAYRSLGSALGSSLGPRVCPAAASSEQYTTETSCVDQNGASLLGLAYYTVVAVDRAPGGSLRESALALPIETPIETTVLGVSSQPAPTTPTGLTSCAGGSAGCTLPSGEPAPSGTAVLTWNKSTDSNGTVPSYRVYRGGTGYPNRYARVYAPPGTSYTTLKWADTAAGGTAHTYRVTAVDNNYKESAQTGPVTG